MTARNNTPDDFDLPDEDASDNQTDKNDAGPFGVAPVDPLVYTQSDDSPELRASAAYVSDLKKRLAAEVFTEAPPTAPETQDLPRWTPDTSGAAQPEQSTPVSTSSVKTTTATMISQIPRAATSILIRIVLFLIPLAVIGLGIWAGLTTIKSGQ